MKTDLPCRIFRNRLGIRFFGVVHEHPELKLNEGLGRVIVLPDVDIAHHGYTNETVRRARFARNIGLLIRDRKEYPERVIGKYLWIRDLAQMCQYEIESGQYDINKMFARAREGITLWRELVSGNNLRMAQEALPFYSELCRIAGNGIDYGFKVGASKLNGGVHLEREQAVEGHFATPEDAMLLMAKISQDRVKPFKTRYF
jgi:hypothetical protein